MVKLGHDGGARGAGTLVMKFGLFYEHQLPQPWAEDSELRLYQQALDQVELADRLGIDYVWEGRAPFPRRVFALFGARGVPRRLLAAHQANPPRPRHHLDAAELQSPGAGRRTHRDAGPGVERPRRVGYRRVGDGGRDGRLRGRPAG